MDGGLTDANFAQSIALECINLGGNAFNATVPSVSSTFQNLQFLYLSWIALFLAICPTCKECQVFF
jgi:hypothetical protein